jgi:mono/diheme cytochrome c family protein
MHTPDRTISLSAAILLLAFASGLTGAAQQQQQTPSPAGALPTLVGNAENGKRLFVKNGCYQCHGYEGQGAGGGPNGSGARLAPDPMPIRGFTSYIRKPSGIMPPYSASVVSDQNIADIYAYLKSRPRPVSVENIPTFDSRK